MNIVEALKSGKKIRRKSWDMMHKYFNYNSECAYTLLGEDITANDWEIIYDLVPFEKALKALKNGKKIRSTHTRGYNYIKLVDGKIIDEDGTEMEMLYSDYIISDWIILD